MSIELVKGRILTQNTIYNLLGQVVPLAVAVVVIPFLIKRLGVERFGVLTLAWMVVGYFSLFDMGIGRATTKYVSELLARDELEKIPELFWTSLILLICFGLSGGIVLVFITPWLVTKILNIPIYLQVETLNAFYLLAISLPLVLASAGTRGVLEAQQRFGLVNAVKIPAGALTFIAPLLVLPFSTSLYHITASLVASRVLAYIFYHNFCMMSLQGVKEFRWMNVGYAYKLFKYGGWLTVTNIIGPFMAYMDRFIIGAMLTLSAVAYYATPYDVVTKLWIIPGSLLGVIFPAFSATFDIDPDKFSNLYEKATRYILLILAPVILSIIILAEPLLRLWLGGEFAVNSTLVLQILAVGVFLNSISQCPYTAIQAVGRPDLTAKLHLIELPVYLVIILIFVLKLGIIGAALAWLLRIVFDTALLLFYAYRLTPVSKLYTGRLGRSIIILTFALITSGYVSTIIGNLMPKLSFLTITLLILIFCLWQLLLTNDDKTYILKLKDIFNNKAIS